MRSLAVPQWSAPIHQRSHEKPAPRAGFFGKRGCMTTTAKKRPGEAATSSEPASQTSQTHKGKLMPIVTTTNSEVARASHLLPLGRTEMAVDMEAMLKLTMKELHDFRSAMN